MSEKKIAGRIVQKHDLEANWLKATNFIPKKGEIVVYDIDENYTYERLKIGDGKTVVSNLPFYLQDEIEDIGASLAEKVELITVDDIDTICGTDILLSSETTF